jgi:hypothetical protein
LIKFVIIFSIAGLAVILFLFTRNTLNIKPHFLIRALAIISILGGVIMTWYAVGIFESVWQKKQWPVASGVIVSSIVVGEKRAFQPQITYRFFIGSMAYENKTDLHMSGFGNKRARRDNAKRVAGEYPTNKQVTVYYNPVNPGESYLRFGPYWSDYMKLMVGVFMLFSGFYFSLLLMRGKSNSVLNH